MKPSFIRRLLAAIAIALGLSACAAVSTADQQAPAVAATDQAAPQPAAPVQPRGPLISNVRQLTFEGLRAGEGYFSADGTQMIFQS